VGQASPPHRLLQINGVSGLGRQPELDGLRALAVLAVLAWHGWTPHVSGGSLGVDVFFVLSGYLITRMLADEIAAKGRIDLPDFAARRLRRLGPALFIVLAAYVAFGPPAAERWRDVAYAGLYLTNVTEALAPRDSPLVHTWSLAAEVQFYLLLPFALPWLIRRSPQRGAAILLAAWLAISLARLGWIHAGGSRGVAYYAPVFHCTGLLLGAALALRPPSIRVGWAGLAVVVGAIVLVDTRRGAGFAYAIPLVELATAVALVNPPRFLAAPALTTLGAISYGIYLWHLPIRWAIRHATGVYAWLPVNVATLVLSATLAAASYLVVEQRFAASRARRPAPITA
jgi:peptidoglycan/LPS O-acetylase OafA/YrhL